VWEAGHFPLELGELLIIWLCFPLAAEFFIFSDLVSLLGVTLGVLLLLIAILGSVLPAGRILHFPTRCGYSFLVLHGR
jgi:hypothetical protein